MIDSNVEPQDQEMNGTSPNGHARRMNRGQLLQRTGLGAIAAIAGLHTVPTLAAAKKKNTDKSKEVLGGWHATVHVDGTPAPFDTLYSFAPGGAFARVDGRNNAPSLGTWRWENNRAILAFTVFSFSPTGQRNGTITARSTLSASPVVGTVKPLTRTLRHQATKGLTPGVQSVRQFSPAR